MSKSVIITPSEPRGASQIVEVQVLQNGLGRIPFPDVQQLRSQGNNNIILKAMRLITLDVLTTAPICGLALAPLAELRKISLVLYSQQWEKGQVIPVLIFNDMQLAAGTFPHSQGATSFDDWSDVDWSKSYLLYSSGSVSASASYAVVFDVQYQRINATTGREIVGAG